MPVLQGAWQAPLVRPLTRRTVWVWATVENEGKSIALPVKLDTGSGFSGLPATDFERLDVNLRTDNRRHLVDRHGVRSAWKGGILDEIQVGRRSFSGVPATVSTLPNLGHELLAQLPWSVDFDRGLITFGANRGQLGTKPLARAVIEQEGNGSYVRLKLGSGDARFDFAISSTTNTLDPERAAELGLDKRALDKVVVDKGEASTAAIDHEYVASTVTIGAMQAGEVSFLPLPKPRKADGILGNEFLQAYNYWVKLDEELRLYKRREILATIQDRISRWSWVPQCDEAPGCATFSVQSDSDDSVVVGVELHRAYSKSAGFSVACLKEGTIDTWMPTLEVLVPPRRSGRVLARVSKSSSKASSKRWALNIADRCDSFSIVDINPASDLFETRPKKGFVRTLPSIR